MNIFVFFFFKVVFKEVVFYYLVVVGGGIVGCVCVLWLVQIGLCIVYIVLFVLVFVLVGLDVWDVCVYVFLFSFQVLLEQLCIWLVFDMMCVQFVYDMWIFGDDVVVCGEYVYFDFYFFVYVVGMF